MYRWSPFPFVRIVLLLATGILLSLQFQSSITVLCSLFASLVCIHLVLLSINKFGTFQFNAIIPLLAILVLGMLRTEVERATNDPLHLVNIKPNSENYLLKIDGYPVEKESHFMFVASLLGYLSNDSVSAANGKVSLYIKKDSSNYLIPEYGDILKVSKRPFLLPEPNNPHEFNYKRYMSYQQIYHQIFLRHADFEIVKNSSSNIFKEYSFKLRAHFKRQIEKNVKEDDSRAIAYALLLGIKDDLNPDLKRAYSAAGAMHVLAVSGLHVGIIFMLISWLFSFLTNIRGGRILLLILNLIFLWGYAFITGLSPSVLRAVVMFSVIIIGKYSGRYANIYNSLAVSALALLIYDPFMILKVGFQLSYLAVLGIVYLQPRIYNLIVFKSYILDKAWSITCVSIAAQVATFPLGLYYFHQFPTYFLVSNLIVIPAAFLILLEGIFLIVLSPLHEKIGELLGWVLDYSIQALNGVVEFINGLSNSLIDWINIDFKQTILIYALILLFILMLHFRKGIYLKLIYPLILIFFISIGFRWSKSIGRSQIVFYELRDNAGIDFIHGSNASIYLANTKDDLSLIQFQVGPNRLANDLPPVTEKFMNEFNKPLAEGLEMLAWKGKRILIVTDEFQPDQYEGKIKCDFLVLSRNVNLKILELGKLVDFKEIIIDSTNKTYHANKLIKEAKELGLKVHFVKRDGAKIVDLS